MTRETCGRLVHLIDGARCRGLFCGAEETSPLAEDARVDQSKPDKWDMRFIGLAQHIATWSKDRSRQVACVIVQEESRSILAVGYNGFPRGVNDEDPARHERPEKYLWTEHAERNAIYNAARNGVSLRGSAIYLPWYPCIDCARAIVQSGICTVVCVEPDWDDPKYGKEFCTARVLFEEARTVNCRFVAGFEPPRQQ